jgi:D-alanyl-lipoteichoic acid acyltransferase DltB (MBOAT superfamily)
MQISKIIIPLGVSFFTLQGIGYLFNIKLGWEKPEKKPYKIYSLYCLLSQIPFGPIERSNHSFLSSRFHKT